MQQDADSPVVDGEASKDNSKATESTTISWNLGSLVTALKEKSSQVYTSDISSLVSTVVSTDTTKKLQMIQRQMNDLATTASEQVVQLKEALLTPESDEEEDPDDIVLPESLSVVANRAENIVTNLSQNLGSFLSKVVSVSTDAQVSPQEMVLSRQQASLKQLKSNINVYTTEPLNFIQSQENYKSLNLDDVRLVHQEFCDTWKLANYAAEISKLFSTDEELRSLHSRLVPHHVTNEQFWYRYFFHVSIVEIAEESRKKIISSAAAGNAALTHAWDDDDEEEKPHLPGRAHMQSEEKASQEDPGKELTVGDSTLKDSSPEPSKSAEIFLKDYEMIGSQQSIEKSPEWEEWE